jgi:hypothetical protein
MILLAGGLALWVLAVLLILSICRAAARADENDTGRRIVAASRRGVSIGMAAAVVTLPAVRSDEADAKRRVPVCGNGDVPYEVAPVKARHALACEIARLRAKRGLGRLRENALLERASKRHAVDMVEHLYFSHESRSGAGPGDRAQRVGYAKASCSWRIGEVLAWGVAGRSTAHATVRAWMGSPEHRRILVSRKYDEVGTWMARGTPERQYPDGVTAAAVFGERHCSP